MSRVTFAGPMAGCIDPLTGTPAARLGLYVHFPYCVSKCPYCDFAVAVVREVPEERYARAVLTELDARLAAEPALRERVHRAFVARYRRRAHPRDREAEKAKYVKRVDFLCDRTNFLGLAPVPSGNPAKGLAPGMVWALHVAKL